MLTLGVNEVLFNCLSPQRQCWNQGGKDAVLGCHCMALEVGFHVEAAALIDVEWDLGKVHSSLLPGYGMFTEVIAGVARHTELPRGGGGGTTSNEDRKRVSSLL